MQSSFSTATITDGPSSSLHSSPSIAGRNFFARKPKACPGKQRFYDCKHKNKHFKGCCPVNPCASAVCPGKKVNAIRVRDSAPKSDVGSPLQFSPYTSYVQVGTGSSSDSSPVTVTSDDPTSTSSSTDSPSSSNSGQGSSSISGGAAAGIGVGCAVGVALLVLAGVLLYKHRKKNVAAGILAGSRYPLDAPPPYQQDAAELPSDNRPSELPGAQTSAELPTVMAPTELPSDSTEIKVPPKEPKAST